MQASTAKTAEFNEAIQLNIATLTQLALATSVHEEINKQLLTAVD